ncbi:hypothetical protein BCR42DRAFT_414735 [Absidia repens]|uniref:BZIP domain-containing protein n=1 Tax=Absidia repens TaxID=90262 RepID=A0A1X2IGV5_9FUNG|nr:hypothetical protein BCR42DRAFT_414735 [Absidia repens]
MSYSYTSPLDSLAFESLETQPPSQINEEAAAADLALWTNAKFTYDITPGQGIMEDKAAPFDLDKAMYEHLAQYLDMDMTTTTAPTTTSPEVPSLPISSARPLAPILLPKPSLDQNSSLFLLPSSPGATVDLSQQTNTHITKKRSSTSSSSFSSDDRSSTSGDDDKRRRNTAASARFRVKKKQKEQAMAQTVRDMTEKADTLQNRVHELENEIKWLRELLLEKNSTKKSD